MTQLDLNAEFLKTCAATGSVIRRRTDVGVLSWRRHGDGARAELVIELDCLDRDNALLRVWDPREEYNENGEICALGDGEGWPSETGMGVGELVNAVLKHNPGEMWRASLRVIKGGETE